MSSGVQCASGERALAWRFEALEQQLARAFELAALELAHQVHRAIGTGGDERQVDVGRHRRRQLDLRALGRFFEPLQRDRVGAQVDAVLALELVGEQVDDHAIEVIAAERRVAVRREHLEHAVLDREDRDVERAAAEIEHGDALVVLVLQAVRERGGGRLVEDLADREAGDLAGVFRRLALGVVEVCRHRDDRFGDLLAEVVLGDALHLREDVRARFPAASAACPRCRSSSRRCARRRPCTGDGARARARRRRSPCGRSGV